ncbi:MAG: hypothetical protein ACK5BN_06205, partial [Planctomycetota bacterium]
DRGIGDFTRSYERASEPPADAAAVSDQIARLWAAEHARARFAAGDRGEAARLAARYRLVTAGAGAVVLENQQQYQQSGLDPGTEIGREPEGPIGSGPVPEASTLVLVATGLLAVWLLRGRHADERPPTAYVAVPYRGSWWYIDDADLDSKSTFFLLTWLFNLQASNAQAIGPMLTVGAGR